MEFFKQCKKQIFMLIGCIGLVWACYGGYVMNKANTLTDNQKLDETITVTNDDLFFYNPNTDGNTINPKKEIPENRYIISTGYDGESLDVVYENICRQTGIDYYPDAGVGMKRIEARLKGYRPTYKYNENATKEYGKKIYKYVWSIPASKISNSNTGCELNLYEILKELCHSKKGYTFTINSSPVMEIDTACGRTAAGGEYVQVYIEDYKMFEGYSFNKDINTNRKIEVYLTWKFVGTADPCADYYEEAFPGHFNNLGHIDSKYVWRYTILADGKQIDINELVNMYNQKIRK